MNEPRPSRQSERPSRLRLFSAIVLGYLAAVGAYVIAMLVFGFLSKYGFDGLPPPRVSSPTYWNEGLSFILSVIGFYAFVTALAMVPLTLLVIPVVLLAAYRLRANFLVTMILDAETGLLPALLVYQVDRGPLFPYAAAAVSGAVFASVIWAICVRPRLRSPARTV
ncbi:MAG: hypothetical protein WAP03_23595 [Methylorubrum rhodinum]|uniref:hypothetical protein n=1 Tax=Methylorubrum rhodinum TaxID=29428 RepID=UPI003BB14E1C